MSEEPILQFFEYGHRAAHVADVLRPFHTLAHTLAQALPRNAERTVTLRRLLEARDAAERALLYQHDYPCDV